MQGGPEKITMGTARMKFKQCLSVSISFTVYNTILYTGELTLEQKAVIMATTLGLKSPSTRTKTTYTVFNNYTDHDLVFTSSKVRRNIESICPLPSGQICKKCMCGDCVCVQCVM